MTVMRGIRTLQGPPRGGLLTLASILLLAGCQEQRVGLSVTSDVVPPTVTITKTAGDTMDVSAGIQFSVGVKDNLGIKLISIVMTGGFAGRVDSTFRTAVTSISVPVTVTFPTNTSAGGRVYIRVTAADGVNNTAVATDSIMLTNINALIVALARPLTGASTSAGKSIQV